MLGSQEYRDLLVADIACSLGVASARDLAGALQRWWERPQGSRGALRVELERVVGLTPEVLGRVEAEVERLLAEAGGDAAGALARRGGLDRSIPSSMAPSGSHALSEAGVGLRAPLRALPADRYVGFELAGEGGMGLVYVAVDTELSRRVAFKTIRTDAGAPRRGAPPPSPLVARVPEVAGRPATAFEELRLRLLQEAHVAGGLDHPGIAPVFEVGQTAAGVPYYTMRYVRGERTLATALEGLRGRSFEARLPLLEPFLKLCDTVAYAHSRGVVHRDLKPANVALGTFGEVVLLDWGLARVAGRRDAAASVWQRGVEDLRDASGLETMDGVAVGTVGYMSPEAALGKVDEVGPASDVYSLGAILYEVLTGRTPCAAPSLVEYALEIFALDVPAAHEVDPGVPRALSDLCSAALHREAGVRVGSVALLAQGLRDWIAEDAAAREVRVLLRESEAALEAASLAGGQVRLDHVERAASALALVERRRPGEPVLQALRSRCVELRTLGHLERERAATRRWVRRAALVALALAGLAAGAVALVIDARRRETDAARRDAQAALAETVRLSDAKRVRDLIDEESRLWPLAPERVPALERWLREARSILQSRERHAQALQRVEALALPTSEAEWDRDHPEQASRAAELEAALANARSREAHELRERPPGWETRSERIAAERGRMEHELARLSADRASRAERFAEPELAWRRSVLRDILDGLERLEPPGRPGAGLLGRVEARLGQVHALARALEEDGAAWRSVIADVAGSARYGGLRLLPAFGLRPLGPDPDSGLQEFAHLASGAPATRDRTTGRLLLAPRSGIVFVLVPGGRYRIGAQAADRTAPHHDPGARDEETPVTEVELSPYFLAKHECTQAQWAALTGGLRPSRFDAINWVDATDRFPVEQVSWADCDAWLPRHGLRLPLEAQWEVACRAGTSTPWSTGESAGSLAGAANVADRSWKVRQGAAVEPGDFDDGWASHWEVGRAAPNPLGFHDMHGNVSELCRDSYEAGYPRTAAPLRDPQRSGSKWRVLRGGSSDHPPWMARSAFRGSWEQSGRATFLGFRPGMRVPREEPASAVR